MMRLCVVDDDEGIRESLRFLFEDSSVICEEAVEGFAALALLRQHPARRVVLLDRMMPRCDGACFLAALAEYPDLRARTAVIFITARGDPPGEALGSLVATHTVASVRKPFDLDILVETVEQAWNQLVEVAPSDKDSQ